MRETVVPRQKQQYLIIGWNLNQRIRLKHIAHIIAVRQHNPLGLCRCPGSIGDIRQIIRPHTPRPQHHLLRMHLLAGFLQLTERNILSVQAAVPPKHKHLLHRLQFPLHLTDHLQIVIGNHQETRFRMIHPEHHLAWRQLHAQRYIHPAGIQNSQLPIHPLIAPLAQQSYPLPPFQSRCHQTSCHLQHLLMHSRISCRQILPLPFLPQIRTLREQPATPLKQINNRIQIFLFHNCPQRYTNPPSPQNLSLPAGDRGYSQPNAILSKPFFLLSFWFHSGIKIIKLLSKPILILLE